jgi:hypothetical protein
VRSGCLSAIAALPACKPIVLLMLSNEALLLYLLLLAVGHSVLQ